MATLEGFLLKDGGWKKGYRKRFFKLSKVYIQYFENEHCTSAKGAAVLGTVKDVKVTDLDQLRFRIIFKSDSWDLQAPTQLDMIKWMETIKPKSAVSFLNAATATLQRTQDSAISSMNENHTYQSLPQAFTVNPHPVRTPSQLISDTARVRTTSSSSAISSCSQPNSSPSVSKETSSPRQPIANESSAQHRSRSISLGQHGDGHRSSPADFKPSLPLYTLSQLRNGSQYVPPAENNYEAPGSAPTTPNTAPPSRNTSLSTNEGSPRHTVLPLTLNLSSDEEDEFLDIDSDIGSYANNPQDADVFLQGGVTNTLTNTLTNVETDGGDTLVSQTIPKLAVVASTPVGTLDNRSVNVPSEEHEYMNTSVTQTTTPAVVSPGDVTPGDVTPDHHVETDSIGSEVSPVPLRRTITSQSIEGGHVHYSISIPAKDTTHLNNTRKSVTEEERRRDSSSLLSVPAAAKNAITTLRVQQWIAKVRPAKKEYVDPEEQEVGALDKFLMEKAPCLPKENINLLQKIGNGAFGEVWKADCDPPISGYTHVAVKCLKEGLSEKHRHDFYGEAALLGQFTHVNVIALHGVVLQDSVPWIVIEYAAKGALKSFLKKNDRHSEELLNYSKDIVRGMRYLSDRGYIHRDLAARNVLVTEQEVCKIADFGLSRKLGDDDDIYVSRGGMVAIKWTAPEGVLGASYSSASDVWSCGVTLWEVFSKGASPWSGLSNEDAFRMIRRGGRLAKPDECPAGVYELLLRCWAPNPMDRITFLALDRELSISDDHIYQNSDDVFPHGHGLEFWS